jgi:hypothetical protein
MIRNKEEAFMSSYNDHNQWAGFLAEFSSRNHFRRARFERFARTGVEEEYEEAHLENIEVDVSGADAPRVIVTRIDNSTAQPRTIVTTITNVKRISPQFDTDNSEDGLEIEGKHGVLTILRMESLVDGAS